ncbi:hypothetical protein glysoja_001230 [Glycine soja]|nr:hypothetical protein glysoja_001230 [Glycine soja]
MACRKFVTGNLDPQRKRSGGLRTKQAGRGSCRGSQDSEFKLAGKCFFSGCETYPFVFFC